MVEASVVLVHMPAIKKPVGPGGSREKACRDRAISGSGVNLCTYHEKTFEM